MEAGLHGGRGRRNAHGYLRRSFARNQVRSGSRESVVMQFGGWKTRSVFDRYNVTTEEDLAEAVGVGASTSRTVPPKRHGSSPSPHKTRTIGGCKEGRRAKEGSGGAQNRTADLGIMSGIQRDDGEPD